LFSNTSALYLLCRLDAQGKLIYEYSVKGYMKQSFMYKLGRIHLLPGKLVRWASGLDKKVELILDSCPPGFDFTEAGRIPVKKIESSIKVMEKINKVGEYKP
jgi:hypothetical protein